MIIEIIKIIKPFILCCTLPGGAGGLVLFIWSFRKGHYRNNKYPSKCFIEIFGAMITSTFITMFFNHTPYQITTAFIIGIGWAGIIQMIRLKITKIVETALGVKINGDIN